MTNEQMKKAHDFVIKKEETFNQLIERHPLENSKDLYTVFENELNTLLEAKYNDGYNMPF